jgi:hypothetical protein
LAVQCLAGIHAAVFFESAVVRSMFCSGVGGVGVFRTQALFIISPFFSTQGMARTDIRAAFPVSPINVAETANASLDMTAAAVEATPLSHPVAPENQGSDVRNQVSGIRYQVSTPQPIRF